MKNGKEKEKRVLEVINEITENLESITIKKIFPQIKKRKGLKKITYSTFRRMVRVLIKENKIYWEKKVLPETKSKGPVYLIRKLVSS